MRKLSLLLVAALSTPALGVVVAAPADATPPKPKAELVTKGPAAAAGSGKVSAGALVKNKGNKRAPASVATFYLSTDAGLSSDDKALGTTPVGKIKPKVAKQVSGIFAVPTSVTTGTYHVVVCADSGRAVKERKEGNNCKGSKGTIKVTATGPPTGAKVTISWTLAPLSLGSVTGVASNGSCTTDLLTGGGSCVVTAGVGTVTLTAEPLLPPLPVFVFQGWSGPSCTSAANPLVLVSPSTDVACTATFA